MLIPLLSILPAILKPARHPAHPDKKRLHPSQQLCSRLWERCFSDLWRWLENMAQNKASNDEGNPVRIVIADDHAVLRESLTLLLRTQPGFQVVGVAASGGEALALVRREHPDVLLL